MTKNCYCFLALFFIDILSTPLCRADWKETKVYEQWLQATGHGFNPITEAAVMEQGVISFIDKDGSDLGKALWFEADRVGADPMVESNGLTASGMEFRHYQSVSISSGFTVMDGKRHHFIIAILDQRVDAYDHDGSKISASSSSMVPLMHMGTEEEAASYMEGIRESAAEQPPSLGCHNPEWIGSGGQECCGYLLALGQGMRACSSRYWFLVSACIPASLAIGGGIFKWCASHCAVAPPLIPACLKSCLVLGGVSSIGSMIICLTGADMAYDECIAEKRAQYWRDLAGSGCKMISPEGATGSQEGGH